MAPVSVICSHKSMAAPSRSRSRRICLVGGERRTRELSETEGRTEDGDKKDGGEDHPEEDRGRQENLHGTTRMTTGVDACV